MEIREAITLARRYVDRDPHLAIYILRDLPEVKAAKLLDLAWAFVNDNVYPNEAKWFVDKLEESLGPEEPEQP
jgi:hypothetical protein